MQFNEKHEAIEETPTSKSTRLCQHLGRRDHIFYLNSWKLTLLKHRRHRDYQLRNTWF